MINGFKIAAVCLTKLTEDSITEFINALHKKLTPKKWRIFVYSTISDLYWRSANEIGEKSVYSLIDYNIVDAVIIFDNKIFDTSTVEKIRSDALNAGVPVINIDGYAEKCYNIRFDYKNGFASIVHHLAGVHGIRDFHYIAGFKNNNFSDDRKQVFKDVLSEYGISFSEDMVSYGDFWSVPAERAIKKLIEEKRVPRAVVCANDVMAIAVSSALIKNGYRIPEDVIVTGFDGLNTIHFSVPKITSCGCSFTALANAAADTILKADCGVIEPGTEYVPTEMILLESCGCCLTTPINAAEYINITNNRFNRFSNEYEKLNELSMNIQRCKRLTDVTEILKNGIFYEMCCLLKTECINFTLNPLEIHSDCILGRDLYVLKDKNDNTQTVGTTISAKQIVPDLNDLLDEGMPLIFISLSFIDIPLGYICFSFGDITLSNYLKIGQITSILNNAVGGFRNMQYQRHLQSMVEDMYKYDSLTGLYNRNGFLRRLRQFEEDGRPETSTLILCDLDGLKYINDNFSHHEGDNAIAVVADALKKACPDGICSRYGGDEFVAVIGRECDAQKIRTGINDSLDKYNSMSDKPYKVSSSIGIYTSSHENFEKMFSKADELMYIEKSGKKHTRK